MQQLHDINDLERIRWACRRGMLELDVLLGRFFEQAYPDLSDEDKQLFIALLSEEDPHLYQWIMGYQPVAKPQFEALVVMIRQNAKPQV